MTIKNSESFELMDLLSRARGIWGPDRLTLGEVVIRLGVDLGKLARIARGASKDEDLLTQTNLETAMGNVIFSMIRWCDDLGLDPRECVARAIAAQERFARENERR